MTYPWATAAIDAWDRFMSYVQFCPVTGCWWWQGGTSSGKGNTAPYGSFWCGGATRRAAIFVCVVTGKMIPGHHVDHLCKQTLCVNPDHLEVVTPSINSSRRWDGLRISDRRAA